MELNLWKEYISNCGVNNCCSILLSITAIVSIYLINKLLQWYRIKKKIKKKCNEINNRKIGLFQKFKGMENPFENIKVICNLSGKEIHTKIRSSNLSAVDVLEAFQANALMKNNELNFLADIVYEADVSSLMIDPKNSSEIMGLPLSISDGLCIEKYDSTFGLLKECFHPSKNDCVVVQVLREIGAIPSIITSTGQGDIMMGTGNPLVGKTLNPFNHSLYCGGNGGASAVAVASKSSVIGIATDLCGNIRIPASICGIVGLKPTSKRISRRFTKSVGCRQNIIDTSIGPMAGNVDDLISLFKSLLNGRMFELDPLCPPIAFNEELLSSKKSLRIGYYINIGSNQPSSAPAVERAVLMAKAALEKSGHELVEYKLPNVDKVFNKVYSMIMVSDAGQSIVRDILKGEPIDSSLKSYVCMLKMPNMFKRFLGSLVSWICQSGGNWLAGLAGTSSVYNLWKLNNLIESYKQEVLASWEKERLDGLICPVLPIVTAPLSGSHCLINENAYAVIYNILDYPAGSVPVTEVNQTDIDNLLKSHSKKPCCQKKNNKQANSLGLPIGVQCVALPWREEIVLRIMKNISDNK